MNKEFIERILSRSIENYKDQIEGYKTWKSNSNIDIKDVYRRIGLNFFHTCLSKGFQPDQIPGIREVLPYNQFTSVI